MLPPKVKLGAIVPLGLGENPEEPRRGKIPGKKPRSLFEKAA